MALAKHSLSEEISDNHLFMDSGIFLRIEGGWFDCLGTYSATFPSFVYGECLPLFRSRVTSKKLTLERFASTVILRSLSQKILQIS